MNNDIIVVKNLSFAYQREKVLDQISFTIKRGDIVGLVGHNGSGKTTLMKLILRLLKPMGGEIYLFGQRLEKFNHWEKIGYLPQTLANANPLFPANVAEIVALGLLAKKSFPRHLSRTDYRLVDEKLAEYDLTTVRNHLIGELSGGQLQRVMLAKTLITQPELLIFDEPTNALDIKMRNKFFKQISYLNRERKTTVILATHDLSCIGNYANKLLYLDRTVVFYDYLTKISQSAKLREIFGADIQQMIYHRH